MEIKIFLDEREIKEFDLRINSINLYMDFLQENLSTLFDNDYVLEFVNNIMKDGNS
jgi:hypothetical protein